MKSKFKIILPTLAMIVTLTACNGNDSKNNVEQNSTTQQDSKLEKNVNELIFGHAFGHCQGEKCVETYRLTNKALFEDSTDDYDHKSFDFKQLSNKEFESVKKLINEVPAELWDIKEGRVGCPDCADGGGVFIQYTKKGKTKSWFIDNNLAQIPESIRDYVKEVKTKTRKLSSTTQQDSKLEKNVNELIFGHAFGHCQGEKCVETYRLTNKALFEDGTDDYEHKSFDFKQLSNKEFESVKNLVNQIPVALWDIKEGRVGCPDCADGGGIFIQYAKKGKTKSWFIDNNLAQIPESIRDYVKEVKAKTQKLSSPEQTQSSNPFEGK